MFPQCTAGHSGVKNRGIWYRHGFQMITRLILVRQQYTFSTRGYHDIQTNMHGSAFYHAVAIYRFDGRRYRLTDCFSKEYSFDIDAKGEERVSTKPTINRTPCRR